MRKLVLLLGLVAISPLSAEEIALVRGKRVPGRLSTTTEARLRFLPAGESAELAPGSIDKILFVDSKAPQTLVGNPFRLLLPFDQHVTGEFLGMDESTCRFKMIGWNETALSRRSIRGLTQLPGRLVLLHEGFEAASPGLKLVGQARLSEAQRTSGRRGLLLDGPGQAAEVSVPAPIRSGRLELNFHIAGRTAGAVWTLECDFGDKTRVKVLLADGEQGPRVKPDLAGSSRSVERVEDRWQRLDIRFQESYLLVGIDGEVIFESERAGPKGTLSAIRLTCDPVGNSPVKGGIHFDELTVAKSLDEARRITPADDQDEVWLESGDQLFGRIRGADPRSIQFATATHRRTLAWSGTRGIFLNHHGAEQHSSSGQHARLWMRTGFPELDVLDGVLISLSDEKVTLSHAALGKLEFARSRMHALRPGFFGLRVEIDNARSLLGEMGRVVGHESPSRAIGPRKQVRFRLESAPAGAYFTVNVHPAANSVKNRSANGSTLEVAVNGKDIGSIQANQIGAARDAPSARLKIPGGMLVQGENTLEIRLQPDADGELGYCVISRLALEFPR